MTEVETQLNTEISKSTASFYHFAFYRLNLYNLIASLSHLEAICLNVTSDALNNCLFLNKKKNRTLVLINNVTHKREALTE